LQGNVNARVRTEVAMLRRMAAITFIFLFTVLAWVVLGSSLLSRTWHTDATLREEVSGLWGSSQRQLSPQVDFFAKVTRIEKETMIDPESNELRQLTREKVDWEHQPVGLDSSAIAVDLRLDQRKKGLLWYSTYGVSFSARYGYTHRSEQEGRLVITYHFPDDGASYDGFLLLVGDETESAATPISSEGEKIVQREVWVKPGDSVPFRIAYDSRGLSWWRYSFGSAVNRVRNFRLTMTTDFDTIDFPGGTISPGTKSRTADGWRLVWDFDTLISGCEIGMEMPKRINPGPLAAKISYFAPVSLGFFFVWIFVITLLRQIDLHPMNYLFLGAAFFAFHLLFAYTVDHVAIAIAFALSSGVSIFLVVSYLRLVVGLRFAAVEAGLSQLIYLVLFSYAHFLEGYTGLFVTIGSILTLFALMQLTGRIDWGEKLGMAGRALGGRGGRGTLAGSPGPSGPTL